MINSTIFRQDAEPKNGLVNRIWEKSISNNMFTPLSIRQLNSYSREKLESIMASMQENEQPVKKRKK